MHDLEILCLTPDFEMLCLVGVWGHQTQCFEITRQTQCFKIRRQMQHFNVQHFCDVYHEWHSVNKMGPVCLSWHDVTLLQHFWARILIGRA